MTCPSVSASRSFSSPRRMRVLTVPSGSSRRSAISRVAQPFVIRELDGHPLQQRQRRRAPAARGASAPRRASRTPRQAASRASCRWTRTFACPRPRTACAAPEPYRSLSSAPSRAATPRPRRATRRSAPPAGTPARRRPGARPRLRVSSPTMRRTANRAAAHGDRTGSPRPPGRRTRGAAATTRSSACDSAAGCIRASAARSHMCPLNSTS